jgi:hypothetical protein
MHKRSLSYRKLNIIRTNKTKPVICLATSMSLALRATMVDPISGPADRSANAALRVAKHAINARAARRRLQSNQPSRSDTT